MARSTGKPPKKVELAAQIAPPELVVKRGPDVVSKAVLRSAQDIARLEQTLRQSAKRVVKKNGSVASAAVEAALPASSSAPMMVEAAPMAEVEVVPVAQSEAVPLAQIDAAPVAQVERRFGRMADEQQIADNAAFLDPLPESKKTVAVEAEKSAGGSEAAEVNMRSAAPECRSSAYAILSLDVLADGLAAMHRVTLAACHVNARVTLDFYRSLASVRSLSDLLQAQTALAHITLDALNEQARAIGSVPQMIVGRSRNAG